MSGVNGFDPSEIDQLDDGPPDPGGGDDFDEADECGRWRNGKLDRQCSKAGSEECDWICPIGLTRRTWP